jgi:translation initiation factor eIF-2B subunit epsilon
MRIGNSLPRLHNRFILDSSHQPGDDALDLLAEAEADSSDSDDDGDESDISSFAPLSRTSSRSSISNPAAAPQSIQALSTAAAESEFVSEVTQSLDRAFDEGHSVENAAVELKTLRMASNVDLRKVREAVIAAIVERIPVVQGDPTTQRKEIAKLVGRWGPLINQIGGIDPVETIEVLQVSTAAGFTFPMLYSQGHFSTIVRGQLASLSLAKYSLHCTKTTLWMRMISVHGIAHPPLRASA